MTVNKNHHDITQIFLIYMTLVGDCEKTALALDLDPEFVAELAKREKWAEKISRVSLMSKSGTPGDWERAQNRALNFVQCHQLRRVLDRAIAHLSVKINEAPASLLTWADKNGNANYTGKVFNDLAASMERVHSMTYAALGDTVKERTERVAKGEENPAQAAGLHAAMIAALNHSSLTKTTAERLVEQAVLKIEAVVAESSPSVVTDKPQ